MNCYKFKKNVTCDLYLIFIDKPFFRLYNYDGISNNEGDLMRDPGTWSIKNNSTFVWDEGIFKIEKLSKKEILLLYYRNNLKGIKCFVRLLNWVQTQRGPKPVDSLDNVK